MSFRNFTGKQIEQKMCKIYVHTDPIKIKRLADNPVVRAKFGWMHSNQVLMFITNCFKLQGK